MLLMDLLIESAISGTLGVGLDLRNTDEVFDAVDQRGHGHVFAVFVVIDFVDELAVAVEALVQKLDDETAQLLEVLVVLHELADDVREVVGHQRRGLHQI